MGRIGAYPILYQGPGRVIIAGRFTTTAGATTAPTVLSGNWGWTITKPAAGRYVITLDVAVSEFDSIVATPWPETVATELVAYIDQDTVDTDSFEIRVSDLAGSLADDTGSEVSFIAVARSTNIVDP